MTTVETTVIPEHEGPSKANVALRTIVAILFFGGFGLFYAYSIWSAIGNFLGVENQAAQLHLGITTVGWVILYAGVALPAVLWLAFALSFVVTAFRRVAAKRPVPVWPFIVLLAVGLLFLAVFTLDAVLGVPATVMFDTGSAG